MPAMTTTAAARPHWLRALWLTAGVVALLVGGVGVFVPLLPTTPFVLLSAFCFSRGCVRCENWLLAHPRLARSCTIGAPSAPCPFAPSNGPA